MDNSEAKPVLRRRRLLPRGRGILLRSVSHFAHEDLLVDSAWTHRWDLMLFRFGGAADEWWTLCSDDFA
jgi:hypothetical protein